jgi:hypothetical protein
MGGLEAVQALWGEGTLFPSELRLAGELVPALKLARDKDIAIFGSGLCGAARHLAAMLNCKLSCYEWDPRLAAAAHTLNSRTKEGFLLKQHTPSMQDGFPAGRHYDAIIAPMRLHERQDRQKLVKQMSSSLKPGAVVCVIDFLSGQELLSSERRERLFPGAATGPLWRKTDLQFALVSGGLKVTADVDVTAKFRDSIVTGFGNMKDVVLTVMRNQAKGSVLAGEALSEQVKLWAARHDALKDGGLDVCCMIAVKPLQPSRP